MFIASRPDATFFSLPQLKAIMGWSAARPRGFEVRIVTDYDQCPEMAELFKYGARGSPLWFVNATQAGTTVITDASGADEELGTVEEALARVLELERPTPYAPCHMRARAPRQGRRPLRPYDP